MKNRYFTGALALGLSLLVSGTAWAGSWDGNTYIDSDMDYQITFPEGYESRATDEDNGLGSCEEGQELRVGLSDDSEAILICLYDAPQIAENDISAQQWALSMKEAWECDSEVTEITFHDCTFSKLTLPKRSKKNIDLYFRRTGDSIVMLETIYKDANKESVGDILKTIKCPE